MALQPFCQQPVISIAPSQTIQEACQMLRQHNIGCLVVADQGTLAGILTDRDIALRVTGEGKDPQRTTVQEVMTPNPVSIAMGQSLHDVTALMRAHRVRRVPIVDGAYKVLGIITLDDLIALFGEELSDLGKTVSESFLRKPVAADP